MIPNVKAIFPIYTAKKKTSNLPLQWQPSKVRIHISDTRTSCPAQSTPIYIMERDTSIYMAKREHTVFEAVKKYILQDRPHLKGTHPIYNRDVERGNIESVDSIQHD